MKNHLFEVAQGDAAMGMGIAIMALLIVVVPLAVLAFIGGKIGGAKAATIAGLLGAAGGIGYLVWVYYDLGNYFVRRDRPTVEIVVPDGYAGPIWVFYEIGVPAPATVAPLRYRIVADDQGRAVLGALPDQDRLFAATWGPAHVFITQDGTPVDQEVDLPSAGSFPGADGIQVWYHGGRIGREPADPFAHDDAREVYRTLRPGTP